MGKTRTNGQEVKMEETKTGMYNSEGICRCSRSPKCAEECSNSKLNPCEYFKNPEN